MELDWLETFLAVVDQGGFTAASEHIHRSQSRVSAHVAGLERALGVQLIDRHRRPAALTAAGLVLSEHARAVLAELDAARSRIETLRAAEETSATVLTTPWLGSTVLPHLLPPVLSRWPDAALAVQETGWPASPSADSWTQFTMAVLPALDQPLPAGLRERPLWRDRVQLVVEPADPLYQTGPITPTQVKQRRLLVGGAADSARLDSLAELGRRASGSTVVGSTQTLVELVRRGVGVGVESAAALRGADTSGVVLLDFDDEDLVVDVSAYWYDSLHSRPVGRALHEALLQLPTPDGAGAVG